MNLSDREVRRGVRGALVAARDALESAAALHAVDGSGLHGELLRVADACVGALERFDGGTIGRPTVERVGRVLADLARRAVLTAGPERPRSWRVRHGAHGCREVGVALRALRVAWVLLGD